MTFATTKTCSQCGETKPSEEFHAKSRSTDGLRAECKACTKAYRDQPKVRRRQRKYIYAWKRSPEHLDYMRQWRHKNPERVREISRRSVAKQKADPELWKQRRERHRRYDRNPWTRLLAGASMMVRAALALGALTKLPCTTCGSKESQAHHANYARPLDVTWLCRKHHMELHTAEWTATPKGRHTKRLQLIAASGVSADT